jgi:hypothetical protein
MTRPAPIRLTMPAESPEDVTIMQNRRLSTETERLLNLWHSHSMHGDPFKIDDFAAANGTTRGAVSMMLFRARRRSDPRALPARGRSLRRQVDSYTMHGRLTA